VIADDEITVAGHAHRAAVLSVLAWTTARSRPFCDSVSRWIFREALVPRCQKSKKLEMSNGSKVEQAERLGWHIQEGSHLGIQLRVDAELSHSIEKRSSVDTQADCSASSTTYPALACRECLYDFLALLPFIVLGGGVDVRS
jgi:hypothetical protein